MSGAAQFRRYDGLQVLRFVAALLVVTLHSMLYTKERLDPSVELWSPGTSGVDIFFVISGFVMVVACRPLEGIHRDWAYFGVRRAIRVMPMYWIATTIKLLTMLALPAVVLHAELSAQTVGFAYLLIPDRNVDGDIQPLLSVGWTLYFEMFFYLLVTIALLLKVRPIFFAGGVLLLCFAGSFFRSDDWSPLTVWLSPIVIYFAIGMVIAELLSLRTDVRRWLWGAVGVGVVVWVLGLTLGQRVSFQGTTIWGIAIVAAVVLAVILAERWLHGRIPKSLLLLGDASYSLYLFHPLVAPVVPEILGRLGWQVPSWFAIIGSISLAIVASVVIYVYVERPLLRVLHDKVPFGRTSKRSASFAASNQAATVTG